MTPRSPDFIGIGAQKAGTWWLRENLRRHPDVWMPPVPELHFFDETLEGTEPLPPLAINRVTGNAWLSWALSTLQSLAASEDLSAAASWAMHAFVDRGDHWYRSLFAFAPPASMTGEITPRYMLCGDDEVAHMHRVAPNAKLIFMLRNPVDRFWSQCKMKHADASLSIGESAAMRLFDSTNGRPRGEYSQAILRFCGPFAPEQVLLVFHDALARQPAEVLQSIHAFLGLRPVAECPAECGRPVNQSPRRDSMPAGLRGRIEAAYRSELEIISDVFGGYARGWLDASDASVPSPAVVSLTGTHLESLRQHHERARRRRLSRGKVFCLSMQRSGTTSLGDWLESHGMKRAGSPTSVRLGWSRHWLQGNYDAIFASDVFQDTEVFEDDPWWCPEFYQVLANRYPDAKFILLERDADEWFDSMCHHSVGRNPGWTDFHARVYEREAELSELLHRQPGLEPSAWGLLSIVEHRDHYKAIYRRHGEMVRACFSGEPRRLFHGRLDDPDAFSFICDFVGVQRNPRISIPHSNARTEEMRRGLSAYLERDPK